MREKFAKFEKNTTVQIDISYVDRIHQTSNIITQDPTKEGILRFFGNINYNHLYEIQPEGSVDNEGEQNQTSALSNAGSSRMGRNSGRGTTSRGSSGGGMSGGSSGGGGY